MTCFDEFFDGYSPAYELIFSAGWTDWEESGWIFIFEREGRFFQITGGDDPPDDPRGVRICKFKMPDHLVEFTQDEALAAMLEWEKDENTDNFGCIEIRTVAGDEIYVVHERGHSNDWWAHREKPPKSAGPHRTAGEALAAVGYNTKEATWPPTTRTTRSG